MYVTERQAEKRLLVGEHRLACRFQYYFVARAVQSSLNRTRTQRITEVVVAPDIKVWFAVEFFAEFNFIILQVAYFLLFPYCWDHAT